MFWDLLFALLINFNLYRTVDDFIVDIHQTDKFEKFERLASWLLFWIGSILLDTVFLIINIHWIFGVLKVYILVQWLMRRKLENFQWCQNNSTLLQQQWQIGIDGATRYVVRAVQVLYKEKRNKQFYLQLAGDAAASITSFAKKHCSG